MHAELLSVAGDQARLFETDNESEILEPVLNESSSSYSESHF